MNEVSTRWITAEVTLLPKEGGWLQYFRLSAWHCGRLDHDMAVAGHDLSSRPARYC